MTAVLAGSLGAVTAQEPSLAAAPAGSGPVVSGSVTLLTGDKVTVSGRGHRVESAPGRQVRYSTQFRDGHLHVIPSDALPLLSEGLLDERLFDVTQLLAWRYGDADTDEIPLISQAPGQQPAPTLTGTRLTRKLDDLGAAAVRVPKSTAARTWRNLVSGSRAPAAGKGRIWLDGRRSFSLDRSTAQIGATEAWKQGFTGQGVTVAVLDSGYDAGHPDLKGVVTQERNFSDEPDMTDRVGHGTHVSSIVAGAGEKYRGVAPGARIAMGKVGGVNGITDSALLAGMEWAATEVRAKVVNMSLGTVDEPGDDPVEQAINTLSERTGTLFVVAAGNGGGEGSVTSPSTADAALSVGAVDRSDRVAAFSDRGPRTGDHAIKPEITAPGVDIVAAAAEGTADGPHVAHSGTSMAAPHVSGAAAVLAQRHPGWTGQQLKAALVDSASPTSGTGPYEQGAGRVDVPRALAQPVVAAPATVWAAFPWRHTGGDRATRTITYTNDGDAPVTLNLTTDTDVLKLPQDKLEVPAGGQASLTLTLDVTGKPAGDYPGVLTAASGDTILRTPAGAYVEPESHDVTVSTVARSGAAPAVVFGMVYDQASGDQRILNFRGGVAKVRLPKGAWNLYTEIYDFDPLVLTTGHRPLPVGDDDLRVTVDAREGRQVRFAVDDPTAVPDQVFGLYLANGPWQYGWYALGQDPNDGNYVIPVRQPGLTYESWTVWHRKDTAPSPYRYDLVDRRTGGIPDDPTYSARTRDLVKASETFRSTGAAGTGTMWTGPLDPAGLGALTLPTRDLSLPSAMTHYRSPGLAWSSEFQTGGARQIGTSPVREHAFSEVWNAAVAGPSFATPGGSRTGDTLRFLAGRLYTDGVAGLTGMDAAATGTLTLSRDGRQLATSDIAGCAPGDSDRCALSATLPQDAGTYTLAASSRRDAAVNALSTGVDAVWTFRSARTAQATPLPLTAVRYAPRGLDTANRARPGSRTPLSIWTERNPGARGAAVRTVKLEFSTDDGATWQPVSTRAAASGWTATIPNPGSPGFVSLRATVKDTAGDGVTQTVTRAYAVG
ncbi:S8 family serine peptidase [Nonomuraea sp. NPDC001831]|uniref:S8 family serine peptidase n=1 Tax=Nonomuraea sp. NPDC001831 TaxID=3364340 RepID=UPI003679129F